MMNIKKNFKNCLLAVAFIFSIMSCDKLKQPILPSDYPKDVAVTPTTDLRFYVSFDSTTAADKQLNIRFSDSISNYPSFFPDASVTAVPGIRGTAYQGNPGTFLHYYSANDFGNSTDFTISFWLNVPLSAKDNSNASAVMALTSSDPTKFWGNFAIYADHSTGGSSDSMDLKFYFQDGTGDQWAYAGYTGSKRWPHMYDGNWHQVAFTYSASTKTGTAYRDGVQFDQQTGTEIIFDKKAYQFIIGGLSEMANIGGKASDNTWQKGWPGQMDQVRLYNTTLSATDILNLYNTKQ